MQYCNKNLNKCLNKYLGYRFTNSFKKFTHTYVKFLTKFAKYKWLELSATNYTVFILHLRVSIVTKALYVRYKDVRL